MKLEVIWEYQIISSFYLLVILFRVFFDDKMNTREVWAMKGYLKKGIACFIFLFSISMSLSFVSALEGTSPIVGNIAVAKVDKFND